MAIEYGGRGGNWAWRYNGASWKQIASLTHGTGGAELHSVSCSSAKFCAVVGDEAFAQTYNGRRWSRSEPAAGLTSAFTLASVSCASRTFCVATGMNGLAVAWRGPRAGWQRTGTVGDGRSVRAVSCANRGDCLAVDSLGYRARFYHGRWEREALLDQTRTIVRTLTCASSSSCFAADEAGNVVRYGSGAWHQPQAVDRHADLGYESRPGLSCVSASSCVLLDWRGYATRYNGRTWKQVARSPFRHSSDISCASSSWCMSIGFNPKNDYYQYAILRGSVWTQPVNLRRPSGLGYGDPSCSSPGHCVITYDANEFSRFTAGKWSTPAVVSKSIKPSVDGLTYLMCSAATACVAEAFRGSIWTFDGSTWSKHASDPGARNGAFACTSLSFCVTSDQYGDAYTFDGSTWAHHGSLILGGTESAPVPAEVLACGSPTMCVASDGFRAAVAT